MTSPLGRVSEKDFQQNVVTLARLTGHLVYHTHDSCRSAAGFPDLVIVGHGQVLFRELKAESGRLSAEQEAWGDWLQQNGADWAVWRPGDWEWIEATLR